MSQDVRNGLPDGPSVSATDSSEARSTVLGSWPPFLAGISLFVLGPLAYFVQIRMKSLATPWYLPALATAGVALMLCSVWRRRGVLRALVIIPFALLCGLEWFAIGVASRTPSYTGSARPGSEIPRFTTQRADGTPFTEADLRTGSSTVVVFYRGRW